MEAAAHRKITRRKGACFACRQRKVRCNGLPTCSQCAKLSLECTYNTGKSDQSNSVKSASVLIRAGMSFPDARGGAKQQLGTTLDLASIIEAQSDFVPDISGFLVDSYSDEWDPGTIISNSYVTPAAGHSEPLSIDCSASSDNAHPLDHIIKFGDNHNWSKSWSKDLCADFSALAPLRLLETVTENFSIGELTGAPHMSFWYKAQRYSINQVADRRPLPSPRRLSYAQRDVLDYIDLFFEERYSYPLFVNRRVIEEILLSVMSTPDCVDGVAFALLNAVLAIGCRMSQKKRRAAIDTAPADTSSTPWSYFSCAISCRDDLQNGQSSLMKLQAVMAMIIFMRYDHDISLTKSLLAQAVHMIPQLRITTISHTTSTQDCDLQEDIERIFWLLYSIEKPYALRFGSHSMIDDDLLTYHAPSKPKPNGTSIDATWYSGWEIINYRYARLCSVIVKTLYGRASLTTSPSGTAASVSRLTNMLEAWRMSIPVVYRPRSSREVEDNQEQPHNFGVETDVFLNYAEASFAIHRWAVVTTACMPDHFSTYISSRDECVAVAKRVLSATHSFQISGEDLNWSCMMLPALSVTILLMIICKSECGKECLPYMGMACGFYGRWQTKGEPSIDLFEDVSELYLFAHRKLKGENARGTHNTIGELSGDHVSFIDFERGQTLTQDKVDIEFLDFPQDDPEGVFDIPCLN